MQESQLQHLPQSPMWVQYAAIKKGALDALLFYRMGDFYELFLDDAVEAASILGITLTARNKNEGVPIPMCGVPFHSSANYINKLLAHGKRVAICEQVEEASATKGLVKREIVRIVSPAMALDQDSLEPSDANFLTVLQLNAENNGALCALDLSTGTCEYALFAGVDELRDLLASLRPKEVLIPNALDDTEQWSQIQSTVGREYFSCVTAVPDFHFAAKGATQFLCDQLSVINLEAFGLSEQHAAIGPVAAAYRRVKDTQKNAELKHLQAPLPRIQKDYLQLDESTLEHLDLLPKPNQAPQESLFFHLNRTQTAPGARKLKEFMLRPSTNLPTISARQDALAGFIEHPTLLNHVRDGLKGMLDLERLMAKVGTLSATPRDLLAIKDVLQKIPALKDSLLAAHQRSPLLRSLGDSLVDFSPLVARLARELREDAPLITREGGIFTAGWHSELDELISLSDGGKEFLLQLEEREKSHTGINSLKVKYNKVFGYYIEVTNSNLSAVPPHYVRKQTTTGGERFITDELKKFEEKILVAEEKRIRLENALFAALVKDISAQSPEILQTARALANLDALHSLALAALEHRYVRPEMLETTTLEINEGRHPTIEHLVGRDQFIANHSQFSEKQRLFILTGPNMAGKSTYMRQVALIALMAHMGSYVPAKSARVGLVDRIATRVGASDRIGRGQSTFMVEMNEMARILRLSTNRSLLLIDEIGRGTSTFDGLALAWSILEDLHFRLRCRTLFATHYHELTQLEKELVGISNLSVAVAEDGKQVRFLHKVIPGAANGSYGVAVAELAGLPAAITQRAQEILQTLEKNSKKRNKQYQDLSQQTQLSMALGTNPIESPDLSKLAADLRALDLDNCTPWNALQTLKDWKIRIRT